jgi:ferredoxin-thioredoxin reductase catalytic chain
MGKHPFAFWIITNNLYLVGIVRTKGERMKTQKRFWRCHVCNDIHFGVKPPEFCPTCGARNAFALCDRNEAVRLLEGLKGKTAWSCETCGDMHLGEKPLLACPSCGVKTKYAPSTKDAMQQASRDVNYVINTSEEVLGVWDDFGEQSKKFKVWEDRESVKQLSLGVLENVKNKGLKYCPCRITTGDPDKDFKLICPCNFLTQQTWKDYGECWCGLFVKR